MWCGHGALVWVAAAAVRCCRGKSRNFTEALVEGGRGPIRVRVRVQMRVPGGPPGSYHPAHGKSCPTEPRLSQIARALCRHRLTLLPLLHHDLPDFSYQHLEGSGLCARCAATVARLLGLVLVDRLPNFAGCLATGAPPDRQTGRDVLKRQQHGLH